MRIEIDTIQKTIVVKDQVTIGALMSELQKMNIDIDKYQIKSDMVSYPYVCYPYQSPYTNPVTKPWEQIITYGTGSVTHSASTPYTLTN